MRSLILSAAAALLFSAAPAFAQNADDGSKPSDPSALKAVDDGYRGRCEANAPKELCSCVIDVADMHLADAAERQVFYDFMMGDVDKAKTARGLFSPEKNIRFNIALQKADVMLGDQCDKLKPEPKEEPAAPTAAPKGGDKTP